jgi:hypothetical protein
MLTGLAVALNRLSTATLGARSTPETEKRSAMTAKADGFTDVNPAEDGWQDVEAEGQVKFDTVGDVFTGTFLGWSESESGIPQAHFASDELGKVFINCGWDLKRQLKDAHKGWMYRLTLTGFQDTGRDSRMMLFRVQFKKP